MSQENIGIARAAFETWNAGDLKAYGELLDLEVVARVPREWPEPGPFVGREAVVNFFHQMRDAFDSDKLEVISDFVDVGDRVVVRGIWHGEGRGPDQPMEFTTMYTIRNGKILNLDFLWDHSEALEAVGLSE